MQQRCRDEVEQIHQFFQDWFLAACDDSEREFARAAGVLAADFTLVTPRGTIESRDSILAQIRALHGARRDAGFRMWIQGFAPRLQIAETCLVMYEEWQELDGVQTARHSSALFRRNDAAPNRVEWVHLHETWLPGRAPAA